MTQSDIDKMKCYICIKWFCRDDISLDNEADREKIIKFHQTARFHKYAGENITYRCEPIAKVKQDNTAQMAINFNKEIL